MSNKSRVVPLSFLRNQLTESGIPAHFHRILRHARTPRLLPALFRKDIKYTFNSQLLVFRRWVKPADPNAALLVNLAHREFRAGRYMVAAAVLRLARSRFPKEPELRRLLLLVGPWLVRRTPRQPAPMFHAALGEAFRILGDRERAIAEFQTALALKEDFAEAHVGLSRLRSPGVPYLVWITRLHEFLRPQTYVEIGVDEGNSICRALPPTRAIGVDPAPSIKTPFKTETHIFAETSNDFFAHRRLDSLLQGQPVALGFIDGLHLFEQALLDFANLEP